MTDTPAPDASAPDTPREEAPPRRSRLRRIMVGFGAAAAVGVLWFLVHAACILVDGFTDDLAEADLAVVLGNEVLPSGEPSARLRARCDRAVELYEQGVVPRILVSGGLGASGFDEGPVMKTYCVSRGVPPEDVFVDLSGVNTYATGRNTKLLMDEHGWTSCIVVSQYYHVSRCRLAFRKHGIETVGTAHADFFEWRDPWAVFREFVAWYYYLLRPYPESDAPAAVRQ